MNYVPLSQRQKLLLIDIDGCIFKQGSRWPDVYGETELLPGVKDKFVEWHLAGHKIILTTGRPECFRAMTVAQLLQYVIPYDMLIMSCPTGVRVLINDVKPEQSDVPTAVAINLERDKGMLDVEI